MKTTAVILSAIALAAACAGPAAAQCEFNSVAKGKGMKASLVRAYWGCPNVSHPSVNTVTGGGTPACSPVDVQPDNHFDATPYVFAPHTGTCDVKTKVRIEKDCSALTDADGNALGLPAAPCHVTYVRARCKDILRYDTTPIDGEADAGWSLYMLVRATFDDPAGGDMTAVDLPLSFRFDNPHEGQIDLDSNSAQALAELLVGHEADAALPTCTTLAIARVQLKDPEGLPFAVLGDSTRGKDE